jgi:hypothetical protein
MRPVNPYEVGVEALGYGDVFAEAEALEGALEEAGLGDEVSWTVLGDEGRGLLMVQLRLDAVSALDAHDTAFTVWLQVWEQAFPEQAPTSTLAVRCLPVADRSENGAVA